MKTEKLVFSHNFLLSMNQTVFFEHQMALLMSKCLFSEKQLTRVHVLVTPEMRREEKLLECKNKHVLFKIGRKAS